MAPMGKYPGDVADDIGRSATGAVKGIVGGAAGGISGAGEQVQRAVDGPFQAIGLKHSPARIVDAPLKGLVRAAENFIDRGIVDSVAMVAEGVTAGLDTVPETLLESRSGGMPNNPLSKLIGR